MDTIRLPEKVKYIIQVLGADGFEAFAVGGCVRDSLLGRVPEDWDITTNAAPDPGAGSPARRKRGDQGRKESL